MERSSERGSFDELVAGISAEERKFLLAKLNQNREKELPLLQPIREEIDNFTLDIKLNHESLLYKFILWLRTLFTKKPKLELYNNDLIGNLARKINREHPGIVDVGNGLLQSLFYEKIKELKYVADFFSPYIAMMNDAQGKFYVFLGAFLAPTITTMINSEVDPYQIPFEREATNELRASLLRRLDAILKDINPNEKTKLYDAVRTLHWLKSFCFLSYTHFITQFTAIISENYTCPFSNAQIDFPGFASVLCNARSVSNEALEALFLFPQRNGGAAVELDGETENSVNQFLSKAATNISMIQMFISTVPMANLGKVVFSDFDWQVSEPGGAEDWFIKFKEEWKCVFDARWSSWLRDRKKAQLAQVLNEKFGLEKFPELTYRPWTRLWGGMPFACEMTAGFLEWFALNEYQTTIQILNALILEGVFLNNENRAELSEGINLFSDVNQDVLDFHASLSPAGSIGSVFQKQIDEHVRTIKGQSLINTIIVNAEASVRSWEAKFCESVRTIERVLHGIMDEERTKDYEGLQNYMTLKGRGNREFRDKLAAAREKINECRQILGEIEPLDMAKNR